MDALHNLSLDINQPNNYVSRVFEENKDICDERCLDAVRKAIDIWCKTQVEANEMLLRSTGLDPSRLEMPLRDFCKGITSGAEKLSNIFDIINLLFRASIVLAVHNILTYLSYSDMSYIDKLLVASVAVNANKISPDVETVLGEMLMIYIDKFFKQ